MDEKQRADLTKKEDLCMGVMNLISLEEHFAYTAMKTGKQEYLHAMDALRKMRIKYMQEIVTNREGELWCISKHLLAVTMRLMETSTKYMESDEEKARDFMKSAFDTYTLFWLMQNVGDGGASGRPRKKNRKMEVKGKKNA